MSLDEGVSRFIGRMYEAVYDADAWHRLMRELMSRTGSRVGLIAFADVRHREFSRTQFYGPETSALELGADEYAEELYKFDMSLKWASKNPCAGVCDTARLMPREDYLKHPFTVWNKSRFGTTHWRVFYTPPVDEISFALSLHPPAEIGPAPPETEQLHKLLFEHMDRALRLGARPPDLSTSAEAVFVLDRSGRVLSMSPRAEQLVRQSDGIALERRFLRPQIDCSERQLEVAIARALTECLTDRAEGSVRIRRKSGRADWLALVSPYRSSLDHLPARTPRAIVRIVEMEIRPTLSASNAVLFGLTAREVQVAESLLQGHSLESLCNLLQMRRNTARVHLQSLFRKTNTSRQAELLLFLSRLA